MAKIQFGVKKNPGSMSRPTQTGVKPATDSDGNSAHHAFEPLFPLRLVLPPTGPYFETSFVIYF